MELSNPPGTDANRPCAKSENFGTCGLSQAKFDIQQKLAYNNQEFREENTELSCEFNQETNVEHERPSFICLDPTVLVVKLLKEREWRLGSSLGVVYRH